LPAGLNSVTTYFGITIVLSLVNWGSMARQMRAKVLAVRESDFVIAARLANCSDLRVILYHLLPSSLSHVIVVATLAIPGMILGETALSFLGLGIRPPMTSWGLLLSQAQETRVLLQKPWYLWPVAPVVITSLSFNLVGDAIRDAVDPFSV
jgi:peptide/nickel transport system permease protein